jgi:vacuolar-type H+-ATPase subunit H
LISLPEFLRRIRRAWAPPGAALRRIAPPTDATARLKAEVRPLLEALADLERSTEAIRATAGEEADRLVKEASRAADEKAREAERAAPRARAAAARRRHAEVDEEIDRVSSEGDQEATRIRAMAERRMAELAEQVKTCVLSGAGTDG